jgi:hypothetical protein
MATRTLAAGFGIGAVAAAIALGLYAIGSPADERGRQLDQRRIRALQGLAASIDEYWNTRGGLPQSIAALTRDPRNATETRDPLSGQEYTYRPVTERTYELCAAFARQSTDGPEAAMWTHPAGTHCFALEVHERGR